MEQNKKALFQITEAAHACGLSRSTLLRMEEQSARRFTITGILPVQGNAGMDFSLKPFCQNIHRISELTGEQIVQKIRTSRA